MGITKTPLSLETPPQRRVLSAGLRTALINDSARQMEVGLMDALHENFLSVLIGACSDADRIEAYHLLDGFGQMLVLDSCCDTKVLQFVVEEVDGVTRLLLTELSQRIREGYVIVFTRYSLHSRALLAHSR